MCILHTFEPFSGGQILVTIPGIDADRGERCRAEHGFKIGFALFMRIAVRRVRQTKAAYGIRLCEACRPPPRSPIWKRDASAGRAKTDKTERKRNLNCRFVHKMHLLRLLAD